jgi:hypothetical protein
MNRIRFGSTTTSSCGSSSSCQFTSGHDARSASPLELLVKRTVNDQRIDRICRMNRIRFGSTTTSSCRSSSSCQFTGGHDARLASPLGLLVKRTVVATIVI